MNKQNETKESTATMVTDAYKSALSTDEGKEALKETMIETAELEARLAVDDAVREAIRDKYPNLHTEYRNSILGRIEGVADTAKLLGGLFKKKK